MAALAAELARFRAWAATVPQGSGEWECDYLEWTALYAAVTAALDDGSWRARPADLLYALARDNECEAIADMLAQRPAVLVELADQAAGAEPEARWQLAHVLGEAGDPACWPALRALADDADEYVRRRALLAMEVARHPDTDRVARTAWATGEEYPQIAALHVLAALAVPDLDALLTAAYGSPHPYLRARAALIRGG